MRLTREVRTRRPTELRRKFWKSIKFIISKDLTPQTQQDIDEHYR